MWITWSKVGTLAFAAFGLFAVAAAVNERVERRAELDGRVRLLAAGLEMAAGPASGARHVVLNGATARVFVTSVPLGLDEAGREADRACGGDASIFDEPTGAATREGGRSRFRRERTHRDDAADGSAAALLCVVAARDTGERREQLTFLRRVDASSTSAVTITRESAMDLATMFPAEGDAPGRDPAGAPRPDHARRLVAATVVESKHDVWIYETTDAFADVVEGYDRRMSADGYEVVAAGNGPARSYRKGDDELVVVFEPSAPARIVISRIATAR